MSMSMIGSLSIQNGYWFFSVDETKYFVFILNFDGRWYGESLFWFARQSLQNATPNDRVQFNSPMVYL